MKTGRNVSVSGQITAKFGNLGFIHDRTGDIALYGDGKYSQGDSIIITGKLSKFNSLLEIQVDSYHLISKSKEIVTPRLVNSISEHEAELVRIENVQFEPSGLFFYPARPGQLIRDRDTIQYWIDENTDVPGLGIPTTSNITGIVSRFGSTFQLIPRSHLDIDNATKNPADIPGSFRILNWNLEFFGAPKYGPINDSLQIANVARVLNTTQADIMALQEISSDNAFTTLIHLLPGYDGRCSNRYSYSFDTSGDFPPQKVCFIYKTSTVNVVREKILFQRTFDDDPSDIFSSGRLPYLLEVRAMSHTLYLVDLHAKSGATNEDRQRRQLDAKLLKDTLDRFYANRDLIFLGDLNDDLDQSIVPGHESPYQNFVSDNQYQCISKSLSDKGWHSTISYDDMIDHQIISSELKDSFRNIRVVNTFSLIPLYAKTTSDHLPILSEFDLTKTITGIVEDQHQQVYPNPTTGDIYFPDLSDLTVINSLGEIVIKRKGAHPPISLSECAPGIYSVVNGTSSFRIVKN
jgi:endonuclease/exonuclease/phosphatase family metal-dependent hydrolase